MLFIIFRVFMSTTRVCKHSDDCFCYVCGYYIGPKQRKDRILQNTRFYSAYEAYFGIPIKHQDKAWVPHFSCGSCHSTLQVWFRGVNRCMPFSIPRIWQEPKNHHDDCYFCVTDVSKIGRQVDRKSITYPDIPSSIAPVPHSPNLPVPHPPSSSNVLLVSDSENEDPHTNTDDEDYVPHGSSAPHFPNQEELNDLVRDLGLSKSNAELLASRLQQWNLLHPSCKVTKYRKMHQSFSTFYEVEDSLCFCNNVNELFQAIGIVHIPSQWCLFIDSSSKSLKAVLLHNGNELPSIPVAHSVHLKEKYENVKLLLHKINYDQYQWDVCGDFKMLGLQGGHTKHPCFLCLWDSRASKEHYVKQQWPKRKELTQGSTTSLTPH
jgi:hypothetical protein